PVKAGRRAVEPGHEPRLGHAGQALEERLLGTEVVGDEPAAVGGPLSDARQGQRVHTFLHDKLGGGVEQRGLRLVAALLLGTAGSDHDLMITSYLSYRQQVCWIGRAPGLLAARQLRAAEWVSRGTGRPRAAFKGA